LKNLESECPICHEKLILRPPPDMDTGEFRFKCHSCGEEIKIEITDGRDFSIEPVKKFRKKDKRRESKRSKVILEEEEWEESIEGDSSQRKFLIMTIAMIIVGVLGIASSISTLAGTFGIKDLEEQTPQEFASLSIWVIDSSSGEGIEGVKIEIDSERGNLTTETDASGLGLFKKVKAGEIDITLSKEGYKKVEGTLIVRKGVPNVQDIPMEKGDQSQVIPIRIQQFETEEYSNFITDIMAVIMMLSSLMAFVAAYSIYKREFFSLAVFTSFLSLFSFGFFAGSLIAFVLLIIVIFSYREFYHIHLIKWFLENRGREDLMDMFRSRKEDAPRLPPPRP